MFAGHRRGVFLGRKRKRPDAGKAVADIRRRKLDLRKQVGEGAHQVVDLFRRRLDLARIALVCNLGGAHQHLFIPGNDKNRTLVDRFGVDRCIRRAREAGQNDVRAADAAHHGMRRSRCGSAGTSRSAQGPVALMIQVASTRSSFPLS